MDAASVWTWNPNQHIVFAVSEADRRWPSLSGSGIFVVRTVAPQTVWNNLIRCILTRRGHYAGLTSFCRDESRPRRRGGGCPRKDAEVGAWISVTRVGSGDGWLPGGRSATPVDFKALYAPRQQRRQHRFSHITGLSALNSSSGQERNVPTKHTDMEVLCFTPINPTFSIRMKLKHFLLPCRSLSSFKYSSS